MRGVTKFAFIRNKLVPGLYRHERCGVCSPDGRLIEYGESHHAHLAGCTQGGRAVATNDDGYVAGGSA